MTVTMHETIWGFLEPGCLIADADGVSWRVQAKRTRLPQIALYLDSGARALWVTKVHDDVVALIDESGSAGIDMVRAVFGDAAVLEVDTLPTSGRAATIALYKAHLQHHHGVAAGHSEKSLAALQELHALEHASPRPGSIPHIHVPQSRR